VTWWPRRSSTDRRYSLLEAWLSTIRIWAIKDRSFHVEPSF